MATASPLARARRSTELSLVVMAGMITAIAYTFASLGQYTQIPARIIPFLLTLLGLLLLAHLAVRWFARGADPTLLPLVALLHGIGYVMITRLDPDRLAGLQTTWSIIAIVAFVVTLAVVQRAADLARYRWTFLFLGVALLVLPLVPGVGSSFGGRPHLGEHRPGQLPARRVRQDRLRHLLRQLPRRQPPADRRRDVEGRPVPPPRAAGLPPRAGGVGVRRTRHGRRARPRLVAAVLHPVRRHAVGLHRAGHLPVPRCRAVLRGRVRVVAACSTTSSCGSSIWLDPWGRRLAGRRLPDRAGAVGHVRRWADGHRPRPGKSRYRAGRRERLHLHLDR